MVDLQGLYLSEKKQILYQNEQQYKKIKEINFKKDIGQRTEERNQK